MPKRYSSEVELEPGTYVVYDENGLEIGRGKVYSKYTPTKRTDELVPALTNESGRYIRVEIHAEPEE